MLLFHHLFLNIYDLLIIKQVVTYFLLDLNLHLIRQVKVIKTQNNRVDYNL